MATSRMMLLVAILAALLLSSSAMATTTEKGGSPPDGSACRRVIDPPDKSCDPESCKASCDLKYHGVGVCEPLGCQCTYCHAPSPPSKLT